MSRNVMVAVDAPVLISDPLALGFVRVRRDVCHDWRYRHHSATVYGLVSPNGEQGLYCTHSGCRMLIWRSTIPTTTGEK